MNSLTAVVPFYNEENFLFDSVSSLLENNIFDQIILIDDNSTDNSGKIAEKLSVENKNINYHRLSKNLGKGGVLRFSQNLINTSHVIIHDADLEYFADDIVHLFDLSKQYKDSMILGSRFVGDKERKNLYFRTLIANKIMSSFFSIVFMYKVSDIATCYKLFPSSFYKKVTIKEN